jgi:ComF family protein
MLENIKKIIGGIIDLLYPPWCVVCKENRASPKDGLVCSACVARIPHLTPPFCAKCGSPYPGNITIDFICSNCASIRYEFTYARSAILATGIALDLIHAFKYQQATWLEPLLGRLFVEAALPDLTSTKWDLIVPVPLHPTRERERGFNQAYVLAKYLSGATQIPIKSVLRRTRYTHTQTTLSKQARLENVQEAFALATTPNLVKNKRVILVDDVFTTGATTNACAKVLRRAGATQVAVWTLARGV